MRDVFACPASMASDVLHSKAFTRWQKSREAKHKVWTAIIARLDGVTQAIVNLGKSLAGR